jgi:hypothetical protein
VVLYGRWRFGPPEPLFEGRLQITTCCVTGDVIVVSDVEKAS